MTTVAMVEMKKHTYVHTEVSVRAAKALPCSGQAVKFCLFVISSL